MKTIENINLNENNCKINLLKKMIKVNQIRKADNQELIVQN